MIDESIKLNTLYVNRHSGMKTFFFFKKNGMLYGTRQEKDIDWTFGTWSNYSEIGNTDDIKEISDLKEMQRKTMISFWKYDPEFM